MKMLERAAKPRALGKHFHEIEHSGMSVAVILLMFLAVMMMARNIEAEREHQQITAADSSEMRPADRIAAPKDCGNKFSSRAFGTEPPLRLPCATAQAQLFREGRSRNAPVTL